MSEIQFVRVDRFQVNDFIAAWENAFSRTLDQSVYSWIFDDKNIIYVLTIDGDIAAGYCLYPLSCVINGKLGKALLCNNVFVNPLYQGKHLFVKIGKLALQEAANSGSGELAYGIPNNLSLAGHKRIGWDVQPPIAFLEKQRRSTNYSLSASWRSHTLSECVRSEIEACSIKAASGRGFSIIKTSEFVRWRYEKKPSAKYWFGLRYSQGELVAYCVCKYYAENRTLHFIDIDGFNDGEISKLIEEAQDVPEDFDLVNVWDSSAHRKLFESQGYRKSALFNNLIFIDPARLAPFEIRGAINVVLGDNDVF